MPLFLGFIVLASGNTSPAGAEPHSGGIHSAFVCSISIFLFQIRKPVQYRLQIAISSGQRGHKFGLSANGNCGLNDCLQLLNMDCITSGKPSADSIQFAVANLLIAKLLALFNGCLLRTYVLLDVKIQINL